MGNKLNKESNWELDEIGGDYRMKYRSWRQGEAENGPFAPPITKDQLQNGHIKSKQPKKMASDFEINPPKHHFAQKILVEPVRLMDDSLIRDWHPEMKTNSPNRSSINPAATAARTSIDDASNVIFPPEVSNNSNNNNNNNTTIGASPRNKKQLNRGTFTVNEIMLDELCRAVTDELVGPEFTSVKNSSPKASEVVVAATDSKNPTTNQHSSPEDPQRPTTGTDQTTNPPVKLVVNHLYKPVFAKVKDHLSSLPDWYTAKTTPHEISRHVRVLLEARRCEPNHVVVVAQPQMDKSMRVIEGVYVVLICARDRRQLLDAITRCVSTRASISEATIVTTGDGYALDRFVLTPRPEEEDSSKFDDLQQWSEMLKNDIDSVLANVPASPALLPEKPRNPKRKSPSNTSKLVNMSLSPPVLTEENVSDSFEVPFQEIRLLRVLGEGRTGKTYLSNWNGEQVAAKVLNEEENFGNDTPKKLKSNLDEFRRELHLVSQLDHPNIVKFLGASARPPRYIILFELMEGGNLGELIRNREKKYSFFQVALDAANGLGFLHRSGVIHRDVKPENLMLDRNGRVKVADFGLSCYASSAAAEFTAETGTYRYMAPEVMKHEHYSFPADVYSFALVCSALLTRKLPFDDLTPLQAAMAVARQNHRPKLPGSLPKDLADLIRICWSSVPSERLDFDTIINILTDLRTQLNNKNSKQLDYGYHSRSRSLSKTLTDSRRSLTPSVV